MPRVEKVTVSLPTDLSARIEQRRRDQERSRSGVVAELLWRSWRHVEDEAREERYRSSYQAQPETEAERSWAEEAVRDLSEARDGGWGAVDSTADATS